MISDTLTRLRVLILEDNPDDAELLVRELQRGNFDPDWKLVDTEQDYLAHLDPAIDVILSDYFMPGFSGLRALRLLRERGLDIPFIIVSGMVGEDAAVAAMQEGAADYLLKDRLGRLGPAIIRVLENRRLRHEKERGDRKLRETEKQLANLLEHAAESIIAVKEDYQIIVFNKAAEKMFGYSAPEALGQPLDLLIPDSLAKGHREHVRNFAALPELSRPIEHRPDLLAKRKDGSEFPVEIGLSKLEADDGIIFTAMIVDITNRKSAEEQVNYHARLLRHINDAVIATDHQFRITAWNRAAERTYGWTAAEVMGRDLDEVLKSGLTPEEQAKAREILRQESSFRSERIHSRRNGQHLFVEENTIAITDARGKVTGYVSVNRDITGRKVAEEALQRAKDFAEDVIQTANVIFLQLDTAGNLLKLNAAAEEISGYSLGEIIGKSWFETLVPRERYPYVWEEFIRIAQRGETPKIFENPILTKHGEERHIIWKNSILREGSEIVGTISFGMDITERKRAEEALQEKERLLSEAQRIGHTGSWSYDLITDTLQYSDEMYRLFGVSPGQFPHTIEAFLELIYPLDHTAVVQWIGDIRMGRQPRELNFRLLHKNGELHHFQCRGAVIFDSLAKPVRFVGMVQDITERKLAEIQIRQQIERLSALRKIDQAITSNFDLPFTLNTILSEVSKQLQVDAADILLLNAEEQVLEYAASQGFRTPAPETARVPMGESLAGRVAKERRLIKIENLKHQPEEPLLSILLAGEDFVCYYGLPLIARGKVKGVMEVFHRTPLHPYPEWLEFFNALAEQTAIAIDDATLFENLQASNLELMKAYDTTIEGWSRALDLRDKETEGHTRRVTAMTLSLARRFGFTEEDLLHLHRGALLHDIGKMGVPDSILLKPEPLTEEEWIIMWKHPKYAYDLLKPIAFLGSALDIPYCHHEKWDGTGYPRGLRGEEIPLAARLFAVVDVWDALTSDRPYRPAWSAEEALAFVREQSGKHFDPQVVEAFISLLHDENTKGSE